MRAFGAVVAMAAAAAVGGYHAEAIGHTCTIPRDAHGKIARAAKQKS